MFKSNESLVEKSTKLLRKKRKPSPTSYSTKKDQFLMLIRTCLPFLPSLFKWQATCCKIFSQGDVHLLIYSTVLPYFHWLWGRNTKKRKLNFTRLFRNACSRKEKNMDANVHEQESDFDNSPQTDKRYQMSNEVF